MNIKITKENMHEYFSQEAIRNINNNVNNEIKEAMLTDRDAGEINIIHIIKNVPTINYGDITVFMESRTRQTQIGKSIIAEVIVRNFQIFDIMPDELLDVYSTYQQNINQQK